MLYQFLFGAKIGIAFNYQFRLFLILIYHSLYKIYRLINSIEIKTEFVKKIFIFEAIWCCEQQYL